MAYIAITGTSESIPVHKGEMKIGKYQNIIIVSFYEFIILSLYFNENMTIAYIGGCRRNRWNKKENYRHSDHGNQVISLHHV